MLAFVSFLFCVNLANKFRGMNTFKGQAGLRLAVIYPNYKGTYVFLQRTTRTAREA
ncbi:hypothetical protein B0G69_1520 [Paraburkholderia sp. RAU2J]|nr:hypothetical protein B0G69_1520 [Paraburkholderia sp. RAU2J]